MKRVVALLILVGMACVTGCSRDGDWPYTDEAARNTGCCLPAEK